MGIISEVLRFVLPQTKTSSTAFSELRRQVGSKGVRTQYHAYIMPNEGFPVPQEIDQVCWYIEWPKESTYRISKEFRSELTKIAQDKPRSLLFEFKETKPGELTKGLESNACEFAIINTIAKAPRFDSKFEHSMDKTFTDCYFAKGFTGGGWAYALNSNDAQGFEVTPDEGKDAFLEEKDRRLAYYVIGWNSIEEHHAFAETELFAEEINKLGPYFGTGTGAFYVKFEKENQIA